MPDIRGAVIVIAGASSGIGRAAAQCFAREGARLVLAGRRQDTLEAVVAARIARGSARRPSPCRPMSVTPRR